MVEKVGDAEVVSVATMVEKVGLAEVVSVATVVEIVEDVVGSSSMMEEGPSVAEDQSLVHDKDIGVIPVGVGEVEEEHTAYKNLHSPTLERQSESPNLMLLLLYSTKAVMIAIQWILTCQSALACA